MDGRTDNEKRTMHCAVHRDNQKRIVLKSNMGSVVMQAIQYAVAMKIRSGEEGEVR